MPQIECEIHEYTKQQHFFWQILKNDDLHIVDYLEKRIHDFGLKLY
jgi:hypothetical protein